MRTQLKKAGISALAVPLFAVGAALMPPAVAAQSGSAPSVRGLPDFTDLVDQVGPAVVNIRSDCAGPAGRTFGQFLSPFRASHPDPAGASLEEVVRTVHAENRDLRSRRRYLRSLIALALSGLAWRAVKEERRDSLFAKHYPVWAGLTTLVVPGLWDAISPDAGAMPQGYRRGVSTGPLAPIVVAATFTGTSLELGVSFRPAAVPAADVRAVLGRYVASLEALP